MTAEWEQTGSQTMTTPTLPGRHHPRIVPVRLRIHDDRVGVDVLRGIGHRAVCDCGFIGPTRRARAVAVADAREHTALTIARDLP